jgi:hypothetical protein
LRILLADDVLGAASKGLANKIVAVVNGASDSHEDISILCESRIRTDTWRIL